MFVNLDPRSIPYVLHPRPVAIVVAGSWDEYTAMAASWVTPVSRDPPMVAVAIARSRYTYELLMRYRSFNLCILPAQLVGAVHKLGTVSGREIKDKLAYAGLTKARPRRGSAPVILESMAVLECELYTSIWAGDHDLVVGRVLEAYVKQGVRVGDPSSYAIPLHVRGNMYARVEPRTVRV